LEHVTYAYGPGKPPVVDNLHLQFGPRRNDRLDGRNGSGKTTLLKLLQGWYPPSSGRILLDGCDLSQFPREQLNHWIGYVPQECHLFSGSIRDNIAKAWPQAPDEEILAASRKAGADAFIVDLPDGYDTEVGEGGHRLSGGQRQRIAIARALLRNPPVLLFDEISSNLDTQAELQLRTHLRNLAQEHTIVLVTHSFPMLQVCDQLIVMDKGRVTIAGPAAAVLEKISSPAPARTA
jgi:ABC-type bacteriocin/lantibiotic exporter with double-glycine peptidase domain